MTISLREDPTEGLEEGISLRYVLQICNAGKLLQVSSGCSGSCTAVHLPVQAASAACHGSGQALHMRFP